MQSREDSDLLSWTLSALVLLIMGVAVWVGSGDSEPAHDSVRGSGSTQSTIAGKIR